MLKLIMDQFRQEISQKFNYSAINQPRRPYTVGPINLRPLQALGMGYSNYFIPNLTDDRFILLPDSLKAFVGQCLKYLEAHQISYADRRLHLALDNSPVLTGQAHREKTWHVDSSQGEKPALIFLPVDSLPTEFLTTPPV